MSAAFTANLLLGHLYTASVTDNALVADTLIFAAMAFIILGGTEDTLTEETVALRLIGAIVNGLGLEYLAKGIFLDLLRRCQPDGDLGEIILDLTFFLVRHNSWDVKC